MIDRTAIKSYNISSLIALFVLVISSIMFIGAVGGMYSTTQKSVLLSITNSYRQKELAAKLVLRNYLTKFNLTIDTYAATTGLGESIQKKKKKDTKEILENIELSEEHLDFDLLFINNNNKGDLYVNSGSPYYQLDSILSSITDKMARSRYSTQIVSIRFDGRTYQILMSQSDVINKDANEVVGTIYGGIVLNDSSDLADSIKRNTSSLGVILSIADITLTSSEQRNSKLYSKMTQILQEENSEEIVIKKDVISKTSILSSLSDRDITITMLDDRMDYQALNNDYLFESTVWLLATFILIFVSVYIFQKTIKNAIDSLHDYTNRIKAKSPTVSFNDTKIKDLNDIGYVLENMLSGQKKSEAKFQAIFNNSFQHIEILSPDGVIEVANDTALQFKSIELDKIEGMPFWKAPWWSHADELQETIKQSVEKAGRGEFIRLDLELYDKLGDKKTIDFSIKPILNDSNSVSMLIAEGRDISSIKLIESELEAHKQRLVETVEERTKELTQSVSDLENAHDELRRITMAVDSSSEAIIIATKTGELFYQNKAFSELFGYRVSEIKSLSGIFPEKAHLEMMIQSIRKGKEWFEKRRLRNKAGEEITILIRGNLTSDSYIGDDLIVMILSDISEFDSVEKKLIIAKSEKSAAENANKTKSAFLANMSHELRTPLHSITSFSKLAIKKLKTHDYHKLEQYLENVIDCSDDLYGLIENLLLLSSLESGQIRYKMHRESVGVLLSDALSQFSTLAKHKEIDLEYIKTDQDCIAYIDTFNIQHVVRCLITNAIQYSDKKKVVTLKSWETTKENIEYVVVEISNNGKTIPEKELSVIFDKFVQGTKTSSGAGSTGLGLSICKKIIEDHNGKIWASSTEGKTVLTFLLPKEPIATELPKV